MTESAAQIVNIFSRWRNLEDEKSRIAEDSRELFQEARNAGFEPKALRLAFRLAAKADEVVSDADKAVIDLAETYLTALGTHPLPRFREMRGILNPGTPVATRADRA